MTDTNKINPTAIETFNPTAQDIIRTADLEDNQPDKIPVIDSTGCCYDKKTDRQIYNCVLKEDKGFIEGYTEDGTKAKYFFDKDKWFFGKEISLLNFVPINDRPLEEQFEIRSKAGTARWKKEREKQTLNDLARSLLEVPMKDKMIEEILGDSKELLEDNRTVGAVMMVKMIQTAMAGSFKAAEFVRDTAGYKPKNEVDISADIMTDDDRSLLDKLSKRLTG